MGENTHIDWSLAYISYPLLLLAKSCKLVPVMLVGVVLLGRRHTRAEYLAVGLITAGVALFSLKPGALKEDALGEEGGEDEAGGKNNAIGLALVREGGAGGNRVGFSRLEVVVFFQVQNETKMSKYIILNQVVQHTYTALSHGNPRERTTQQCTYAKAPPLSCVSCGIKFVFPSPLARGRFLLF